MKINTYVATLYKESSNYITSNQKALVQSESSDYASTKKVDSLEVSSEAYEMQENDENMSATSGKDTLGITKGAAKHSFVIHFSDSAMISRTVTRGYILINGTKIELSDETKKQLTKVDKQAQIERENAFNQYMLQQNMAVAKQQGETWKTAFEDLAEAFEIAAKISSGCKVSSSDMRKLMEISPQLYALAMSAAMMSERQKDKSTENISKVENNDNSNAVDENTDIQDERKYYETQMTVSMEDTPEIQSISIGEIVI